MATLYIDGCSIAASVNALRKTSRLAQDINLPACMHREPYVHEFYEILCDIICPDGQNHFKGFNRSHRCS